MALAPAELLRQITLITEDRLAVHVSVGARVVREDARVEVVWALVEEAPEHIKAIADTLEARRKRHAISSALPAGCPPESLVALLASSVGYTMSPAVCPWIDAECIRCGWSMLESLAQSGPPHSAAWARAALGGRSSQGFWEAVQGASDAPAEGPDADSFEYWDEVLRGSTGGELGVALPADAYDYNPSVASLACKLAAAFGGPR